MSSSVAVEPAAELHDRLDLFAEGAVRYAHDRGVEHVGMVEQDVLHLDAVHVLAGADDHVLGPVDEVHEALVVDARDVAGAEPTAREEHRAVASARFQ